MTTKEQDWADKEAVNLLGMVKAALVAGLKNDDILPLLASTLRLADARGCERSASATLAAVQSNFSTPAKAE
jgi:hypothetical protein